MKVKAQLKYLRMAPRKVRMAADLIRGKNLKQARALLEFSLKKSARPMKKLLESALANAKNNFQAEEDSLFISEIFVNEGPKLKRWRPRSRGRAAQIQKKTSHITLILEGEKEKRKPASLPLTKESEDLFKKELEKKEKKEAPVKKKRYPEGSGPKPRIEKKQKAKPEVGGLKKVFRRKSF